MTDCSLPAVGRETGRNMYNLLAVVVSHGGSTCLPRLLGVFAGLASCRVELVENQLTDRPNGVPRGVRVHSGHGNIGYGAAVNLAVRRLLDDTAAPGADADADGNADAGLPDWLLIVNSDVTVPSATAEKLPELLASVADDVDAVGFVMRDDDGAPGRSTAVLPSTRTSVFTALRGEPAAVARWPELRYPIGAFFAIRMAAFRRLRGFDPGFWLYYEETDLFARLLADGGRIDWMDESWAIGHTGGGTAGQAGELQRELGRAAALYARRHRATLGRGWPAVHAAQLLVLAARKLATGLPADAARAARILAGLVAGLVRPGWEPAVRSRWNAVPAAARQRLAALPPTAPRADPPTLVTSQAGTARAS